MRVLRKRMNRSTIPFLILSIVHLLLFLITMKKNANKKKLLPLFFTNMGLAYIFEMIVFNWFEAYQYRPKISSNRYVDSNFGAALSQLVFIPTTAIFITVYKIGWKGKLLFSTYFSIIEWLFLKMKLFSNRWWKTRYTFMMLLVNYYISDMIFKKLKEGSHTILILAKIIFTFMIHLNLLYIYTLWKNIPFHFYRKNKWKQHFIIVQAYSIIIAIVTKVFFSRNTSYKAIIKSLAFMKIVELFIKKMNIANITSRVMNFIHFTTIFATLYYHKKLQTTFRSE